MNQIGIIVLHGLNSRSEDMKELVNFLNERGFKTVSPTLTGENGSKAEWRSSTWKDWLLNAEKEFLTLKDQCRKVIVIGYSMGGLVALNLVHKYGADMMITISTPIYYGDRKRIVDNIIRGIKENKHSPIKNYCSVVYNTPINCVINFKQFLRQTIPLVEQVRIPILVMQGLKDDIVKWTSADYIFNHVKSNIKKKIYYRNADHGILDSQFKEDICNEIFHYIVSESKLTASI